MADKPIRSLSEETLRSLARELREAKGESRGFEGQREAVEIQGTRLVRWARLQTTSLVSTYPARGDSGSLWPGVLGVVEHSNTPGGGPDEFEFVPFEHNGERMFCDSLGRYWPEDSIVRVQLHSGKWWIADEHSLGAITILIPDDGIPGRSGSTVGSAECDVWYIDDDDDLHAYLDRAGDQVTAVVKNIFIEAIDVAGFGGARWDWPSAHYVVDLAPCGTPDPDDTPAAATVTNVTSADANGDYYTGDTITISVAFSKTVTVNTSGGTPRLVLETGGPTTYATYTGGSGSTSLLFNVTFATGEASTDLDYVGTSSLELNGGTILGAFDTPATLTLPTPGAAGSLGANKAIRVNQPVHVVDVTSPDANGNYTDGQSISITIEFSGVVDVTGTPELELAVDGGTLTATYASGTGTDTLTFDLDVTTDHTSDLDYVGTSSLTLAGGTITTGGVAATLTLPTPGATHSLGANKNIVLNGTSTPHEDVFDSSDTWVVPAGIDGDVTIEIWGNGGNGADGTTGSDTPYGETDIESASVADNSGVFDVAWYAGSQALDSILLEESADSGATWTILGSGAWNDAGFTTDAWTTSRQWRLVGVIGSTRYKILNASNVWVEWSGDPTSFTTSGNFQRGDAIDGAGGTGGGGGGGGGYTTSDETLTAGQSMTITIGSLGTGCSILIGVLSLNAGDGGTATTATGGSGGTGSTSNGTAGTTATGATGGDGGAAAGSGGAGGDGGAVDTAGSNGSAPGGGGGGGGAGTGLPAGGDGAPGRVKLTYNVIE